VTRRRPTLRELARARGCEPAELRAWLRAEIRERRLEEAAKLTRVDPNKRLA
jgi:hypothetical protein